MIKIKDEYPSGSQFIGAAKNHKYMSADSKVIKVGDVVYQMDFIANTRTPVLRPFVVKTLLSDGRVHAVGEIVVDATTSKKDLTISSRQFYLDPVELTKVWVVYVQEKVRIELPQMVDGIKKILSDLGQPNLLEDIQVGNIIEEESEI